MATDKTRASIASLISKPKCTDKLLARPPFRFLFDVIVAIDAATDLRLDQVLSSHEFDSTNLSDKASKLAFLAKVVKCIEGKLNTSIDLNPRKVVAGLEPEKTCAFLQLLVAATKISSDGKAATGDDDGRSKDTDDEVLPSDDGLDKKDGDVPDTLDLTSQSQFLPVANDSTLEDKQHTCSRVDSATDADETAINSGEDGEAEEPTSIEIPDESNGAIDIGDNGEEIPEAERMEDAVQNTLIDDAPSAHDDPGSIFVIAEKEKETTIWPLKAIPGPPIEDDDTSHFDAAMNTESVGGGGASDIINNADSAPVTLQAAIEAVISVTSDLGRCFDAINIGVINEERAHWSNQITVETGKLEEFRRQQDATVLAPLMQRIDAVDAKIVEKEKEIEASLQRIGDDEVEEN